jgi:hypothetical protein
VATTVVVGVASFVGALMVARIAPSWAFFASPTRAWEFAIGALGVLLVPAWVRLSARVTQTVAWAGLATVLVAAVTFGATTRHPGPISLLPVLGTVVVLMAGARDAGTGVGRVLSAGWLQWVGRLSYSWYLWHWPLLVLGQVAFPHGGAPLRLLLVALSLGLAAATLRLVENPIRYNRSLARRTRLTLAAAVGLTLAAGGLSGGVRVLAVRLQAAPGQAAFTRAGRDEPRVPPECHLLSAFASEAGECVLANPAAPVTVALFGDSHALQWLPAMERLARQNGWKLVSLTKAGCPAASVPPPPPLDAAEQACLRWRGATLERLAALSPDVVVMTSANTHVRAGAAKWQAATARTLAVFGEAGVPVVLLRDTPWPETHVPHCLARSAWTAWWLGRRPCTFPRTTPLAELAARHEQAAAASFPGVRYVDMTPVICGASACDPYRDGVVLYYDSHHLSATFSATLAPALERALRPMLPPSAAPPAQRAE